MSTQPDKKPRASFGTHKKDAPGVLERSHAMYTGLLASVLIYASPTIALVAFLALIQAAEAAQQIVTSTKAKGSGSARDAKIDALWTAMVSLRAYVQVTVNTMQLADAIAAIQAAGLLVAGIPTHVKPILDVKLTSVPGAVHLVANATLLLGGKQGLNKKHYFSWQISSDGGKTWTALPTTTYASTDVSGLTLLTEYQFRVSVTIGKTAGEWSQAIKLLPH